MHSYEDNGLDAPSNGETFGWGLLRPPPMPAVAFGALYGLIAGMIIVYDIVVLFRTGKALAPRLKERLPLIGSGASADDE